LSFDQEKYQIPEFQSTYMGFDTSFSWLRGNHHGYSTTSDGEDDPLKILQSYENEGYQYIAFSEHDILQNPSELTPHTSMCILPAVEVTSRFKQTLLFLGADRVLPKETLTPLEIMHEADTPESLFIFNHPNWQPWPDYATDDLLDTMIGLRGIEIYTGVIRRLKGNPNAWDRLLSKGWRIFGHATDDQHCADDQFIAWNCVQWPLGKPVTTAGIIEALVDGRFYASTGVLINHVGTTDDQRAVRVESDAKAIRWITQNGVVVKEDKTGTSTLTAEEFTRTMNPSASSTSMFYYLRAECLGDNDEFAWTQPFWLRHD